MNSQPKVSDDPAERRRPVVPRLQELLGQKQPAAHGQDARATKAPALQELVEQKQQRPMLAELYHRAEVLLRTPRKSRAAKAGAPKTDHDPQRLLHELEVHQIELELQNTELRQARDELEAALKNYTDLYDFAPAGYFTLAATGAIRQVNLTGAQLVGIERSRLVGRAFGQFVSAAQRAVFDAFLKQVFGGEEPAALDIELPVKGRPVQIVRVRAKRSPNGLDCRVVLVDITEIKQAEGAQRRLEVITASNRKLEAEILRRQAVETALKQSEQQQTRLLEHSHSMQEQLRHLSRQVLQAQEDERKRISRELHDVIAQTLTGINVRLATLKKGAGLNAKDFDRDIELTQKLVEESVNIVHHFARELRPAVLDDLGLIPALHSFLKNFAAESGIHTHLTAFAGVEKLDAARRTILYRVAQEALTNVVRHAQASHVEVSIQKRAAGVCMKIIDNGKSFSVERVLNAKGRKRLGLLGMRERLEMVGGRFEIESAPGHGTTVSAEMPFSKGV